MEGIDVVSVVLPDVQHHYTAFFEAARSPFLSSFGRCVDVTATKQIPLPKTRNARNSDRSGFNRVLRTAFPTKSIFKTTDSLVRVTLYVSKRAFESVKLSDFESVKNVVTRICSKAGTNFIFGSIGSEARVSGIDDRSNRSR